MSQKFRLKQIKQEISSRKKLIGITDSSDARKGL